MKQKNTKKDYPFEQTGGQNRGTQSRISAQTLSEMMNPSSMNYFGAVCTLADQ